MTQERVQLPVLKLKPRHDKRLRAGHMWIYSNEVDTARSPLKSFQPGQAVTVLSSGGQPVGTALVNPQALICARLVSSAPNALLDEQWLSERLQAALQLRQGFFDEPFYRWVYGDSDGLPGLVIDRFDSVLVVQANTVAMDQREAQLLSVLAELIPGCSVLMRNDSRARSAEGLAEEVRVASGSVPEWVPLRENGCDFEAPLGAGQKTGWFYDHRVNRAQVSSLAKGKRVLDVFSYLGGWGVQAAHAGASEVVCVDASKAALQGVERNAALNGLSSVVSTLQGDAFDQLKALKAQRERFDIVVLDPPAFIQRRKDMKAGEQAYQRLNELALPLLQAGGLLVSASCSMHLSHGRLLELMQAAAVKRQRRLQLVGTGGQGPDHPVHPAIPETAYLKAQVAAVS